jgi:hypothetical protein
MPVAFSGAVDWLIRVPGYGMKNSPMSDASRVAALVLSGSALAYSFWSNLPSTTRVSLATGGGWPGAGGPVSLLSSAEP